MKKLTIQLFTVLLFASSVCFVKAQTPIPQCKVLYNIQVIGDAATNAKQLPKEMTLYAKGLISKSETMINSSPVIVITDAKLGEAYTLISTGGKFTYTTSTRVDATNQRNAQNILVTPSSETKIIAGLNCKKVTVTEDNNAPRTIWFTEDIANANDLKIALPQVNGLMLEFDSKINGVNVRYTATQIIPQSIDDNEFFIPTYYTPAVLEEN